MPDGSLKKYCYIIFVIKHFFRVVTILLGIVVSALVFYAGGPGSIPGLWVNLYSRS